jgi:hypothetical protein
MYLFELGEIPTEKLNQEIHRRKNCFRNEECWYCERPLAIHECKLKTEVNKEFNEWSKHEVSS